MKTLTKTFDAVQYMRQARNRLSEKLAQMNKTEMLVYFEKRKKELSIRPMA